jgi:hypothetical protein
VSILEIFAFIGIAMAVTVTMAGVDYAHARYALEMAEVRRRAPGWRKNLRRAANWSVVQWAAAAVGFYVSVRVSMWFLPFEAAGLWAGTQLGGTREGS